MTTQKPLRLWPAVVIAIVQLLVMFGAPVVASDATPVSGIVGGIVGALAVLVWCYFSAAPWSERIGAIILMIVAVLATLVRIGQEMAAFRLSLATR